MANIRVILDFNELLSKELDELVKELGMNTKAELFNNALAFYEWVINERNKGMKVGSIKVKKRFFRKDQQIFIELVSP